MVDLVFVRRLMDPLLTSLLLLFIYLLFVMDFVVSDFASMYCWDTPDKFYLLDVPLIRCLTQCACVMCWINYFFSNANKKFTPKKFLQDEVVIIIVTIVVMVVVVPSRRYRPRDALGMFVLVLVLRLSRLDGTARRTNGLVLLRARRTPSHTIPKNRTTSTFNDTTRNILLLLLPRCGHRRE